MTLRFPGPALPPHAEDCRALVSVVPGTASGDHHAENKGFGDGARPQAVRPLVQGPSHHLPRRELCWAGTGPKCSNTQVSLVAEGSPDPDQHPQPPPTAPHHRSQLPRRAMPPCAPTTRRILTPGSTSPRAGRIPTVAVPVTTVSTSPSCQFSTGSGCRKTRHARPGSKRPSCGTHFGRR